MKRLIAFISILLLVSSAYGTATSITIYGTNKSNAQTNITCYGCNNTISVQAWNTSYVKNITVESRNGTGGDVVSFNISNVTAFQVQELKVNKTAVNAYQAGANGMLNFSYTVVGNKTLVLSPAQNVNGYNMTWIKTWKQSIYGTMSILNATKATNTVYQAADNPIMLTVSCTHTTATSFRILTGAQNPPTSVIVSTGDAYNRIATVIIPANNYYNLHSVGGACTLNSWTEWS